MTLPELWGWVELLLTELGVWQYLTLAVQVLIVVSLSFWVVGKLTRS